jgi:hypothetical protein
LELGGKPDVTGCEGILLVFSMVDAAWPSADVPWLRTSLAFVAVADPVFWVWGFHVNHLMVGG